MGNQSSSPLSNQIENIVREVVNHPRFFSAVGNYNAVAKPDQSNTTIVSCHTSSSSSPSTMCNNPASSSTSAGSAEFSDGQRNQQTTVNQGCSSSSGRTPREEFSMLFRTGANRSRPDIPAFQRRTNWGPQPRSRSTSSVRKKTPYSSSTKTKPATKPLTFSREVVLLNTTSAQLPRGKAKGPRLSCIVQETY